VAASSAGASGITNAVHSSSSIVAARPTRLALNAVDTPKRVDDHHQRGGAREGEHPSLRCSRR
jgi:hypothetical protein